MKSKLFKTPGERRSAIAFYGFISPVLIGWVVFLFGPLLYSFYLSFTNYNVLTPPVFTGLDNYIKLVNDERFHAALFNTFYFVVIFVPLSTIMALIMAMLLHSVRHAKAFFRSVFYLPSIVPSVPATLVFIWILNYKYGLLNALLRLFHLPALAWMSNPALLKPSLIIISFWGFGTSMLIFLAGLEAVPREYYEASSIDGASIWQQFWAITMPLISPSLLFIFITKLINAFQVFTSVYILGGTNSVGGPRDAILFIVPYLFNQGFKLGRFGYASAIAWALAIIIMALTLLSLRASERHVYYETSAEEK